MYSNEMKMKQNGKLITIFLKIEWERVVWLRRRNKVLHLHTLITQSAMHLLKSLIFGRFRFYF